MFDCQTRTRLMTANILLSMSGATVALNDLTAPNIIKWQVYYTNNKANSTSDRMTATGTRAWWCVCFFTGHHVTILHTMSISPQSCIWLVYVY